MDREDLMNMAMMAHQLKVLHGRMDVTRLIVLSLLSHASSDAHAQIAASLSEVEKALRTQDTSDAYLEGATEEIAQGRAYLPPS